MLQLSDSEKDTFDLPNNVSMPESAEKSTLVSDAKFLERFDSNQQTVDRRQIHEDYRGELSVNIGNTDLEKEIILCKVVQFLLLRQLKIDNKKKAID